MTCGMVMPISEIDGCSKSHWEDVKRILSEAIEGAGFVPKLVSDSNDVGVIHKRIIQNLYDNEVVVVDVSCRNPNVMLELGMRLAFDKPTIIVKDDVTKYSFDTSPIEHLSYRRDLRYYDVEDFKSTLGSKIKATYEASKKEGYTTFLKHFGDFVVTKLNKTEVSKEDFIIQELSELRYMVGRGYSRPTPRIVEDRETTRRAPRALLIRATRGILEDIPDEMPDDDKLEYLEARLKDEVPLGDYFDSKREFHDWALKRIKS